MEGQRKWEGRLVPRAGSGHASDCREQGNPAEHRALCPLSGGSHNPAPVILLSEPAHGEVAVSAQDIMLGTCSQPLWAHRLLWSFLSAEPVTFTSAHGIPVTPFTWEYGARFAKFSDS